MIYLDHAATSSLDSVVREAMETALRQATGNPSSLHAAGRAARARIEVARAQVATVLQTEPESIVFTSGATESDNLAILGAARAARTRGLHVVTAKTEHRAVLDAVSALAREGFSTTLLKPDAEGLISAARVEQAIRSDTVLLSMMLVNNETGVVQDIEAIAAVCHRRGVLLHVDAAQAVGRVPFTAASLGADLISLSSHKIHGPMGIGALYLRQNPRPALAPLLFGGGQEQALRPGTLPMHQIVGMGMAYARVHELADHEIPRLAGLTQRLWRQLQALPAIHLNGSIRYRAPHILNVSFVGVDGEALRYALPDLALSSGSACSAGDPESSYVLRALGRDDALAQASLRFSVGRTTTETEIDEAALAVVAAVTRLRTLAPL
jgi:cysteine desulfurase